MGHAKEGGAYMLKCIEIVDTIRIDCLDSHQLTIDRPLTGLRNSPGGGEIIIGFSEAAVGDPVALRQKATSSRHPLKPVQTSAAEFGVIQ